ncbi:MAG: hypothetical protein A3F68_00035 [Acidobacteria bacterium RIFCSPLOWO2_12_FULL_54_10]|nr:MAG: hypothetical protein A3F68_00035 [Acidobacteria bacterium RIFCSPLOWO2_12_FULL_54_10]
MHLGGANVSHRITSRILLSLLFTNSPSFAQEQPAATIKVEVSVVNVLCTVRDSKGRLVSNLEKPDFVIRVDGKPQQISYFSRESELPLTLGLLVDSSVSQQRLISHEQDAAAAFFEQVLRDKDMAFLIDFSVNVTLLQDVTNSVEYLQSSLDGIRVNTSSGNTGPFPTTRSGGTRLYDAVYLGSMDVLKKEAGRKALILITDGQDSGSTISREDALRAAQETDTIIYTILFLDREFYGYGGRGYQGDTVMREISEETGGRLFRAESREELEMAFGQISEELRNQYSLGFTPTNSARDGKFREIDVDVKSRGYRVQTRKGYYAPKTR